MYLIVDANVLLGAVFGKSLALIEAIEASGTLLLVPEPMMHEAQRIVGDPDRVFAADAPIRLQAVETAVTILDLSHYQEREARARERLSEAGQSDWPLVASALALDAPIWSNDKHLWGVGVAVWRTQAMRYWGVS